MSYIRQIIAASLVCLVMATTSASAQPGTGALGPVSRANIGISLSIAPRIQADRLQRAEADIDGGEPFCIWSNASIGTFSVSAVPERGAAPSVIQRSGASGERGVVPDGGTGLAGLRTQSNASCASSSAIANLLVVNAAKSAGATAARSSAVLLLIAPD